MTFDVHAADADAGPTDPRPRSRKGFETRARLVAAARAVFERDGFLHARISDITAGANLSQGSFYHYFESKEQIFREVAEAQEQRLTERNTQPGEDRRGDRPPREVIGAANRRYFDRYREASALMGVIEQVSRYDEPVNRARIATMQHFARRAEESIRRLQAAGSADPKLNPEIAADALGAMVGRFAEIWLVQGYRDYDFDEAVDQISRLWANALGIPATSVRDETPSPATGTHR